MSKKNKPKRNEYEDDYDIRSSRNRKKSKSRRKRKDTKHILQDFKDCKNNESQNIEDINEWYGDTLNKDW
ncbi:MAG: hypothetical protein H8D80_02575 [Proteobacteria bacterium]|nr:hypothetical protein [Pseudomonadota bacterium]